MARTKASARKKVKQQREKSKQVTEVDENRTLKEEESRVRELWDEITEYWETEAPDSIKTWNGPIDESEFAEFEEKLGFPLPNDFKEFYRVHDGQNDGGYEHPLFGGNEQICCSSLADGFENDLLEDETCTEENYPGEELEFIMQKERERDPELDVLYSSTLLKKRSLESGETQEAIKPDNISLPTVENTRKRFARLHEFRKWNYLGALIFGYASQEEGSHGYCLMAFSLKEDATVFGYEVGFWHFQELRPYSIIPFDVGSKYWQLFPEQLIAPYYELSAPKPLRFLEWLENYVYYLKTQKLETHRPEEAAEEEEDFGECLIYGDTFHLDLQRPHVQKSARK